MVRISQRACTFLWLSEVLCGQTSAYLGPGQFPAGIKSKNSTRKMSPSAPIVTGRMQARGHQTHSMQETHRFPGWSGSHGFHIHPIQSRLSQNPRSPHSWQRSVSFPASMFQGCVTIRCCPPQVNQKFITDFQGCTSF